MELNKQQREAVTYSGEATNILVTAGAGCGKTRTITARAIHLVKSNTSASRILMMTFTNRAAKEMKQRIKNDLGTVSEQIQIGTFHSFCLKVLKKMPNSFGISGLNIIDSDDQNSLMSIVRRRYINKLEKKINKEFPKPSELINYYSHSRNTCQMAHRYLSANTDLNEHFIEMCSEIFSAYQQEKEKRGYLDYDDLLEHFTNALSQKPKLKNAITNLFDEVLVDEMQDTNPLQFSILKHFSNEGVRLFCVGDPAQSIYKSRGAEFEHMYRFDEIFGNSINFNLSLNYRSYQQILDLSNWLLERSPLDYQVQLEANRGKHGELPIICDFDSSQTEASWIADIILERKENINLNDMMILVRSSFDAKPIEAELIHRKIPYYFIGGTSLTKSAHVRDVLALLRIIRNEQDDLAWIRFLKLWPGIGNKTADKLLNSLHINTGEIAIDILAKNLGREHNAIIAFKRAEELQHIPKFCISKAIERLTPILEERYDKWVSRVQDLKLLVTVAEQYQTISDFIDAFTLEPMTHTEIEKLEVEDAILVITIHSAKGTEAPICFVPNAKQGTYPHSRSFGDIDSEEEERRILYVAFTRAMNELIITRSTDYRSGFYLQNKPTEGEEYFLSDIPEDLVLKEISGWRPTFGGLFSLKDEY